MTRARPSLHARPDALQVDRARAELRAGRPVRVRGTDETRIVAAIDTLDSALLGGLTALPDAELGVASTRERGDALGLAAAGPFGLRIAAHVALADLRAFAGADHGAEADVTGSAFAARAGELVAATEVERAALELAKLALLLPAVITARDDEAGHPHLLCVDARAIAGYGDAATLQLERLTEAAVPLADAPDCRMVVFRDRRDGNEHVAVLVGLVDPGRIVDVRVHSACLTGDLLGSLRCDCGDQLRGAVRRFAALGGGVLLYVGQEGRGIGLANKLRAYRLQETGLDTIDADRHLGFAGDERRYELAAALLRELGIGRVRLHTNNPRKAGALSGLGVDVVDFRTLAGAVNPHNERYIRVRRERAGHVAPDAK
jgi:GTP cyclohydrolase II